MLRWGYGIENVPYMFWHFLKNKKMPWRQKIKPIYSQFVGSCSWATIPVLIILLGNLPIFIAHAQGANQTIVYNSPFVLSWLMTAAMVGLLTMNFFSILLLPPKPKDYKNYHYLEMIFQWLFLPVTMIVFGSIPA